MRIKEQYGATGSPADQMRGHVPLRRSFTEIIERVNAYLCLQIRVCACACVRVC